MGYFKPWWRKFGLVNLALACALSACWFRSYSTNDTMTVPLSDTKYLQVASSNQQLIFGSVLVTPIQGDSAKRLPLWMANPTEFKGMKRKQWRIATFGDQHLDKYFDKARPNIGRGMAWNRMQTGSSEFTIDYRFVATMYWWFVLPLALLSAWLLVARPRVKKPTVNDDVPS